MDRKDVECVMEGKTLLIHNIEKNAAIQIFNDQGRLCAEQVSGGDSDRIELENPGMYVLVVQLHGRTVTRKVILKP